MIRRSRDHDALAYMRAVNPSSVEDLRESIGEEHLARAMRQAIAAGHAPAAPIPVGDRVAREGAAPGSRGQVGILSRPARRLALAVGVAVIAVVAAVAVLGGGASGPASRAHGAELIRFAESTPLLLLESPGWRVEELNQYKGREGAEGFMTFLTGKPIPDEAVRVTPLGNGQLSLEGMLPAAVRQRKVELTWRSAEARRPEIGRPSVRLPVLGTTALVNTRAGRMTFTNEAGTQVLEPGEQGDRQMAAVWSEGGYALELRAAVPDLAAFEERLSWLERVDSQTWLDAMPASVVETAEHDAVVREMLKGIPLPSSFRPSKIPDEGLATSRTQVANSVMATVSCLWFRQWGEARRRGDRPAAIEAEKAMATAPSWPIVAQSSLPETLLKLVKSMPSGAWQFGPHRWRLLPKAEGLGCARLGIPVLPRKMKRQREHGPPLPPG